MNITFWPPVPGGSSNDFTDALKTKLNDLPLAADLPTDLSEFTDTTNLISTSTTQVPCTEEDWSADRFIGFNGALCDYDAKAIGVAAESVLSGEGATGPVHSFGIVPVEVGEAITLAGSKIASNGVGQAVVATETSEINGYAVTTGSTGTILVRLV